MPSPTLAVLCELLGITLELRSAAGEGTTMTLRVPLETYGALASAPAPLTSSLSFAGLTVLVIDDERSVRMGMRVLLEELGCTFVEASSIEEATREAAAARPDVILATNTSSISITRLAAATSRPGKFIGMHFFNPVPVMTLVELIRGHLTEDATVAATVALAKVLGKTPIVVTNSPGFVVNRILCPMLNEAVLALQEGLASAEEIDNGMKQGCGHPIGPLALIDMVGLDVLLAVMEVFYRDFNDPKYRPALLLKEMVAAGQLGRKSGRGFYTYA